jgi:hypothetical protein
METKEEVETWHQETRSDSTERAEKILVASTVTIIKIMELWTKTARTVMANAARTRPAGVAPIFRPQQTTFHSLTNKAREIQPCRARSRVFGATSGSARRKRLSWNT